MENKKPLNKKVIIYTGLFWGLILIILTTSFYKRILTNNSIKNEQVYGITIDDGWYEDVELNDVIEGIKHLEIRPTVRIVMSREIEPAEYVTLFESVNEYADIMACPVDSSEMINFKDTKSYLNRFRDSYENLSQYVSIWEVGNEINGTEWIKQKPEFIVDKVSTAAEFIKSKNGKTALTLHCNNLPDKYMIDWAGKYLSVKLTETSDYCLVSYYEDDNDGYSPDWESIFDKLGEIFPTAFLGIGECGNTAVNATEKSKIEMAERYYLMPKLHERYVGGYFWWCWVKDCIPHENNKVYEAIKSCMQMQTEQGS